MALLTRIAEAIVTMIFMLLVLYIILQGRVDNTGPEIIAGLDLFEIIVMIFMFIIGLYQRKVSILQSNNSGKLDEILKEVHINTKADIARDVAIQANSNRILRLEGDTLINTTDIESLTVRVEKLEGPSQNRTKKVRK